MIRHYLLLSALILTLIGCQGGKNQTNIELIQDMMDQISLKAQDHGLKPPPANTVPVGFKPYPYKNDPTRAEASLVNPLAGNFSPEVLDLGKQNFEIYCGICHGDSGNGEGHVAGKMNLRPPSLLTDKVKNFRDGRIFHIITDGQGVMNKYIYQIRDERARWAVVNYVRSLGRK